VTNAICPDCGVKEVDGFKSHLSDCQFKERQRNYERSLREARERHDRWDNRLRRELRASAEAIIITVLVVLVAILVGLFFGGLAE
jgi:hypothetical protein